jgi:hypothetical protein
MKQLLQVVGEKRKLFLPVGAKTCFGGWPAKKQLLQVVGGKRKLFLPVGAKTCFGGEAPGRRMSAQDLSSEENGGADDEDFRVFLNERCYDWHSAPAEDARSFSFGRGNLWRIAVDWLGSPGHRACIARPRPVRAIRRGGC